MTAMTKKPGAPLPTLLSDKHADELIHVLRAFVHGDIHGPTGLEMLSMAIGGEGIGQPLGMSLKEAAYDIKEGLNNLADAIRRVDNLADAIRRAVPDAAAEIKEGLTDVGASLGDLVDQRAKESAR